MRNVYCSYWPAQQLLLVLNYYYYYYYYYYYCCEGAGDNSNSISECCQLKPVWRVILI